MDQNPSSFSPFGNNGTGQQNQPNVPPPPSFDQQVGVRTMQSDMESIRQSGGEAPQSQVVSAAEAFGAQPMAQQPAPQYAAPQPSPAYQQAPAAPQPQAAPQQPADAFGQGFGGYGPMPQFGAQPEMPQAAAAPFVAEEPAKKSSFDAKTILIIVGVVIVAAAVGFGVFKLVSSLRGGTEEPAPAAGDQNANGGLPIGEMNIPSPAAATTTEAAPSPSPAAEAFTHASLLSKVTKLEQVQLSALSSQDIASAIASSSKEKLIVGAVKDLSFVDSSNAPVSSRYIVQSFFPGSFSSLSSLIGNDFTAWLYGDKLGGNKLGIVLTLKPTVTKEQAVGVMSQIESNPQDLVNLFLSSVSLPASPEFKDGVIEGVPVRFLAFNAKMQQVFEYALVTKGGSNHLIIATSYNQMVALLKDMKPSALSVSAPSQGSATTTAQ
jgi:hypothetical protein